MRLRKLEGRWGILISQFSMGIYCMMEKMERAELIKVLTPTQVKAQEAKMQNSGMRYRESV